MLTQLYTFSSQALFSAVQSKIGTLPTELILSEDPSALKACLSEILTSTTFVFPPWKV